MTKKLLTTIAAVSAIALSAPAFAATNVAPKGTTGAPNLSGFYVTAQAGYSMAAASSSAGPNFTSTLDEANEGYTTGSTKMLASKKNGLAGRLAIGYNIDQYFGVELGGAIYHGYDRSLKLTGNKVNTIDDLTVKSATLNGKAFSTKLYVVDLLAKATTPTFDGVSAYAKAGVADVESKTAKFSYTYNATLTDGLDTFGGSTQTVASKAFSKNFVRPEVAAGVAYNITQNIAADVSYSYIIGKGKSDEKKYLPNLGFASLGLTYKF